MMRFLAFLFLVFLLSCTRRDREENCSLQLDKIIYEFSQKEQEKGCFLVGSGGRVRENQVREVSLFFDTYEVLQIPTARKLIVEMVQDLSNLIKNDSKYLLCFSEGQPLYKSFRIFVASMTPLVTEAEIITGVSLARGEVCYSLDLSKEVQPSKTVHEETYEEALEIVAKKNN